MFDDTRRRVQQELQRLEIDAYLAGTPANIYYTTGFFSPVVNLSFRLMGTDAALIPADPSLPPALITSDFAAPAARAVTSIDDIRAYRMWVENRDLDVIAGPDGANARLSRPPQWNPDEIDATLTAILSDRGLSAATIGIDLRYVYADTLFRLQRSNPECRFVDATGMMYGLRAVKQPLEIEKHRQAARLFEAGLRRAIADARPGQSAREIKYRYQAGALDAAIADPSVGELQSAFGFISAGAGAGSSFGGRAGLSPGDLIKFDCGVAVDGFYSDCGRTFAYGRASAEQRRVHDALAEAHAAARQLLRPGHHHIGNLPRRRCRNAVPRLPRLQPRPLRPLHRPRHLCRGTPVHQRHRAQPAATGNAALPRNSLLLRRPGLLPDRGYATDNRNRRRKFQHPALRTGGTIASQIRQA